MDAVDLLRKTELFPGVDHDLLARLGALGEDRSMTRGETLFEQGQPAGQLYVLVEGGVGVRMAVEDYGDVLVESATQPGVVLGWSALVEPYTHGYTARCTEGGRVMTIPAEPLLALLAGNSDLSITVYRALTQALATRLNQTRLSLVSLLSRGQISQG